jgi:uncharacterized protein
VAKQYIVKQSSIHGKGIFAKKNIKAGQKIGRYKGTIITNEESYERFVDVDGHSHTFFFSIDEDHVIDGGDNGNGLKYCNHSCSPNAEAKNEGKKVKVYALQDIKKGNEIFYDYLLEFPGKITKKILKKYACFCGSPNCRGTQLNVKTKASK